MDAKKLIKDEVVGNDKAWAYAVDYEVEEN